MQWLIGKVILYRFPGLFSLECNFQYGRCWPSWILMFGLVKIQEMIPGNKHILLKTSFSCESQQVIWVIWLKTEKMELVDGDHLEFWYLDSSKYIQKWALYDHLLKSYIFNISAGVHLEFWWLDWSKYKNDARNGFSMPKLVGKVVLHSFRYQFVFKLHFQYGHRRPFWILASHKFRRHFREVHRG